MQKQTFGELYDEMLRETCGEIKIGSLTYDADHVLKQVDPTAYRCGFVDWLDSLECRECSGSDFSRAEEHDDYRDTCDDCQPS